MCLHFVNFVSYRPNYPMETTEEESLIDDNAELTLSKVEEELIVSVPSLRNLVLVMFNIFVYTMWNVF